jgi:hypothetical protein
MESIHPLYSFVCVFFLVCVCEETVQSNPIQSNPIQWIPLSRQLISIECIYGRQIGLADYWDTNYVHLDKTG